MDAAQRHMTRLRLRWIVVDLIFQWSSNIRVDLDTSAALWCGDGVASMSNRLTVWLGVLAIVVALLVGYQAFRDAQASRELALTQQRLDRLMSFRVETGEALHWILRQNAVADTAAKSGNKSKERAEWQQLIDGIGTRYSTLSRKYNADKGLFRDVSQRQLSQKNSETDLIWKEVVQKQGEGHYEGAVGDAVLLKDLKELIQRQYDFISMLDKVLEEEINETREKLVSIERASDVKRKLFGRIRGFLEGPTG